MMTFVKPFDSVEVVSTSPGCRMRKDYVKRIDERGEPFLFEAGQTDLQEFIQSFADETDIGYVLNRFVNGDTDILNRRQGFYADVTGLPRDLASAYASMSFAKDVYDHLSADEQQVVGSFDAFLGAFASKDSFIDLGKKLSSCRFDSKKKDGVVDET